MIDDADGKIAEVTIFWRPLPSAVEIQAQVAPSVGMEPWELRTNPSDEQEESTS